MPGGSQLLWALTRGGRRAQRGGEWEPSGKRHNQEMGVAPAAQVRQGRAQGAPRGHTEGVHTTPSLRI